MPTIEAFLSYNAEDREFARSLCDALRKLGVNVWMDEDHRDTGATWPAVQADAIQESKFFVTLFGPHGIGAEQEREINFALFLLKNRKIGFIPILIQGYDETKLTAFGQFVQSNFSSHDLREGLEPGNVHALASLIKSDINPPPMPAPAQGVNRTVVQGKSPRLRVLALAGGSGARSGHLSELLATRLTEMFGEYSCQVIPMERYYIGSFRTRTEAHMNRYGEANFEDPDIIDFEQMVKDTEKLHAGSAIQIPIYDKKAHAPKDFELIQPPSHFVILEGAYLLHDKTIRNISDATFYIDVAPEIRFANRVWTDCHKFRMKLPEVLAYYCRAVKPAFEKFVRPHKRHAKLTLNLKADFAAGKLDSDVVPLNYSAAVDRAMAFLNKQGLL